jgi:hypothetical protein
MKCTDRITGHGSGSAVQLAPPSVVASREAVPTAQPSSPVMKSTEVKLSLPDSCVIQCAPPSAVARIESWLTAQPCAADTNCSPPMPPGYEDGCAAGQERPLAAAADAGPPARAEMAGADGAGVDGAGFVAAEAAGPAAEPVA